MVLHEQPDKIHLWFKNYEAGVKSNPFMAKKSLSYVPIKGSLNHWIFYQLNAIHEQPKSSIDEHSPKISLSLTKYLLTQPFMKSQKSFLNELFVRLN